MAWQKQAIIIAPILSPRAFRGGVAQGVLLAASNAAKGDASVVRKVIVLLPDVEVEPRSVV